MSDQQLRYSQPKRRSNRSSIKRHGYSTSSTANSNNNKRKRNSMSGGSFVGFGAIGGGRKDDPVFNVKFVQLVERHSCLWNSTLPAYSKKDEIQRAWQAIAIDTKDTVRNCRERWRTIRSSFLRSLKLSRTSTGRGKRKYYLSKYLQFLIPYTKTRYKSPAAVTCALSNNNNHSSSSIATRRLAALAQADLVATAPPQFANAMPMTRINHIPQSLNNNNSDGDTKDSAASEMAIAEEDVLVSLHEGGRSSTPIQPQQPRPLLPQLQLHPRLLAIKLEQDACAVNSGSSTSDPRRACIGNTSGTATYQHVCNQLPRGSSTVDLTEFAEWIKIKADAQRHFSNSSGDADELFLNSLHPFLKEMSGKQNRRFRQKVVALIDAVLDNAD